MGAKIKRLSPINSETINRAYCEVVRQKRELFGDPRLCEYNFIYVGRLSKEKNIEMLIKAFKILIANLEDSFLILFNERNLLGKIDFFMKKSDK